MSRRVTPLSPQSMPASSSQLRETLRDLARWAVTSTLGLTAACSAYHDSGLSQGVPDVRGIAGNAGVDTKVAPSGGQAGTAVSSPQPPMLVGHAGSTAPSLVPPVVTRPITQPPMTTPVTPPDAGPVPPGSGRPGPWQPIPCSDGSPDLLVNIKAARPFDYAAIYRSQAYRIDDGDGGDAASASISLLAEAGNACATAGNPNACAATLQTLRVPGTACETQLSCDTFLLTTAGDNVTRAEGRAAFVAFLGSIDSPEKAELLALFDGYNVNCPFGSGNGTRSAATPNGYSLLLDWDSCGAGHLSQQLDVSASGTIVASMTQVTGNSGCAIGRRPVGLAPARERVQSSPLGAFFAEAARLEAASVFAFERLARELAALDAPGELIADAARSALDEVRHAAMVGMLAHRFGGQLLRAEVAVLPPRVAFDVALENAIEGCVRETYGALVAHHQAATAENPATRSAMLQIAEDETRHACLAWEVARWLEPRLSHAQRQALAVARAETLADLLRDPGPALSPAEARLIGWPSPELAVQLAARLGHALALV